MSTKTRNLLAPLVALTLVSFTMAQPAYAGDHETQGDDTVTETYSWLMPNGGTNTNVTWPQSLVGLGDRPAPCGVTYQVDTYTGTRAEIDSVVSDGVLTGSAEDGFLLTGASWHFNIGAVCIPKQPKAVVSETNWVEDVPICTPEEPIPGGGRVRVTNTLTTTPFVWDDEAVAWVDGTPVVTAQESSRDATLTECPVAVTPPAPPVVAPPAPAPAPPAPPVAVAPVPVVAPVAVVQAPAQRKAPVAVAKPQLAETGAASGALALLGGALALSGVCLVAVGRKLRRI